ncbi:MAG TPA: hypothetical protein VFN10_15465 [Thermoanaerobaculia bacterium]|nr:hypothetical protein [Thermoanaerobaculia bacterium]
MNKIVCLGGTGQMLLHYYLQLYLIGAVETPFEAVVIDTDEIIPSIGEMSAFFDRLSSNGTQVPSIRTIQVGADGAAASAYELLTAIHREQAPPLVPAQAFFDTDTLEQDLTNGLFARPALSAVVSFDELDVSVITPEPASTVVVAGSIIGGTGGGLIEPVINLIHRLLEANRITAAVRAVLFGEYFQPDHGRGIDLRRLQSNQLFVLRTAKEALQELHSFAIIGGPQSPKIANLPDKNAPNIVWPDDEAAPFWQGVQALHHLLTDQIRPRNTDFRRREVTAIPNGLNLKHCQQRLSNALHVEETLINREVVSRMAAEPWLRYIWGSGVTDLVCHYWRIAAKVAGEWDRVTDFPALLQNALETTWRGGGSTKGRGLSTVFPTVAARHTVRPRTFRRLQWPVHDHGAQWDRSLFDSASTAAARCAAEVSFHALRKGN